MTGLSRLPRHITFENTSACNLRCFMCEHHRPEVVNKHDLMRAALFDKVLSEVKDEVSIVSLTTTGEPFIDAQVSVKLQHLARYPHIAVEVVTNGALLDEKRFQVFAGMRNHIYLSVSLDSVDADVYRTIRAPEELETVLENLRQLTQWAARYEVPNFHLGVSMVMMRRNIHGLLPLIEMAHACGADRVGLSHVTLFETERDRSESLFTMREQANKLIDEGAARGKELGLTIYAPPRFAITAEEIDRTSTAKVTTCPYLEGRTYVGWDGHVEACCHSRRPIMGSVTEMPMAEVWGNDLHHSYRNGLAAGAPRAPCDGCYILELYKPFLLDSRPFGVEPELDEGVGR